MRNILTILFLSSLACSCVSKSDYEELEYESQQKEVLGS